MARLILGSYTARGECPLLDLASRCVPSGLATSGRARAQIHVRGLEGSTRLGLSGGA